MHLSPSETSALSSLPEMYKLIYLIIAVQAIVFGKMIVEIVKSILASKKAQDGKAQEKYCDGANCPIRESCAKCSGILDRLIGLHEARDADGALRWYNKESVECIIRDTDQTVTAVSTNLENIRNDLKANTAAILAISTRVEVSASEMSSVMRASHDVLTTLTRALEARHGQ